MLGDPRGTEGGPNERFWRSSYGGGNTLQNSTFYYFNHDYTYEPDERRSGIQSTFGFLCGGKTVSD
ncbi:hypothetical protein OK016_00825 [Vibrio chagasii]|nr:hypothetical protein [Vibrio chagasii]